MRILHLDLRAFGPFTNVAIDLSQGEEGLHVLYGPNEAGKSSALRALEQMLFGIPARSADDFIHSYQNLRIGATLSNRGAPPLAFLRRKRAKNSLVGPDDTSPLDDSALAPFLGGLDRDLFGAMFGIGHAQLVQGGKEIVGGSGDVGQLLFAAGAGIADLQAIQSQLENDAAELFLPRGSTRKINQSLKALDEARKKIRQGQLPSEEWEFHQRSLGEARARRKEMDDRLLTLQTENNRLARIRQALPVIVRRKETLLHLDSLRGVPVLAPGFAEQRRDAVSGQDVARTNQEKAKEELDRVTRELQSLDVPEAILAQSAAIESLADELGSFRKAQRDLPSLRANRERTTVRRRSILKRVRPDLSSDAADALRLSDPQRLAIQTLGKRHEAAVLKLQQVRQEIEDAEHELSSLESQAARLEEPRDAGPLKDAIRRTQNQGDLESQLADARAKLGSLRERAAVELSRLPLWSRALAELEKIAVPAVETVDRFAAQFTAADQVLARLAEEIEQCKVRRSETAQKLEQLELEGEVPTEEDLAAARALRDRGWQLVRDVWQQGPLAAERLAEFLARFPTEPGLAEAFTRSIEAADEISDRLRREANRVAQRAGLVAEQHAIERQAERAAEQRELAVAQREKLIDAWQAAWRPASIEPLTPQEMQPWLAQQRSLIQQAEAIRAGEDVVAQIAARIESHRAELAQCLAALRRTDSILSPCAEPAGTGSSASDPADGSLHRWLERSQTTLDRLTAAADRREQIRRDSKKFEAALKAARVKADRAETELNAWNQQWAAAIAPLGLAPETSPETADYVLAQIAEMFVRRAKAQDHSERIEGIQRDAEEFQRRVEMLVGETAPNWPVPLSSRPPNSCSSGSRRPRATGKSGPTSRNKSSDTRPNMRRRGRPSKARPRAWPPCARRRAAKRPQNCPRSSAPRRPQRACKRISGRWTISSPN